jgi:hypothetical protein
VILRSESCETHDHILLSQIRDSPNLEGQVPLFISPRNLVAQLYLQALGSLVFASYDSATVGGTLPRLHTGSWMLAIQSRGGPNRKHHPQQLYCYRRLPSDSPDILDVFIGRYQATHVPYHSRYIATVLQVIWNIFFRNQKHQGTPEPTAGGSA